MPDLNSAASSRHVVVIGAGVTGLSAAHELRRQGMLVTVVEKEPQVGGMARTLDFMGCRFDVGPRPFRFKTPELDAILAETLPDKVPEVSRLTRIFYRGKFFDYPVRPQQALLNLGPVEMARGLASFARWQFKPVPDPRSYEDWVSKLLGHRLFEIFFKTYTEKVWGISTGELSADCATDPRARLTRVEVTSNAQLPAEDPVAVVRASANMPAGSFRYPPRGAGQVCEVMAGRLAQAGCAVRLGEQIVAVRHAGGRVLSVVARDRRGGTVDLLGSEFISTMPIGELVGILQPAAPSMVRSAAEALRYRALITLNVVVDRAHVFPDQWIDVPDAAVKVSRISNFKNFSREMVSDSELSGLGMEYFCFETDGLWGLADAELLDLGRRELVALGLCRPDEVKAGMVHRQLKAYLLYDAYYPEHLAVIREWLARALPNLWLTQQIADGTAADSRLVAQLIAS